MRDDRRGRSLVQFFSRPQPFRPPIARPAICPTTTPPTSAPTALAATSTPVGIAVIGQAMVYSQPPATPPMTLATFRYHGSGSGGVGPCGHHFRGQGVPHQPTSAQSSQVITASS